MKISENEKWIRIALGEGRKGIGLTAPNPPVGAVVVKDGVEIARGWHH
ncbi:riboflavin biosynthesis protein RibD, partial [Akkermansiaceae bacterium]|nr:riboflavin biosynthesis protein RibD [Akkermansiaceae bacterium]MDB4799118.1 riboflavin biosynthesis protein RibD [bacterium]